MQHLRRLTTVVAVLLTAAASTACAQAAAQRSAQKLKVSGATVQIATGVQTASVYFKLTNPTGKAVELTNVSTTAASSAMMMTGTSMSMSMTPVRVPAHHTVTFRSGHSYVMLMGVKHSAIKAKTVTLKLSFSKGAPLSVKAKVTHGGSGAMMAT